MPSIHFFGVQNVTDAFEGYNVTVWGVFEGKYLLRTGEGVEELGKYLNLLKDTPIVYTLKVYNDIDDDETENITSKTVSNGQFNFRLDGNFTSAGSVSGPHRSGSIDEVTERINGIVSKEVADVIEQKFNGTREPQTFMDIATDTLNDPEKMRGVIGLVRELRGLFNKTPAPMTIGSPVRTTGAAIPAEQKMQRIAAALDILEKYDPKILEHLERLAMLAQDDIDTFNFAIKKLDML